MATKKTRVAADITEPSSLGKRSLPRKLRLAVIEGPSAGNSLNLEVGTYRVGREETCELRLNDPKVSREHLVVEVLSDSVRLIDNGSKGGSFLGKSRFQQIEANAGARIRLGKSVLELQEVNTPDDLHRFFGLVGKSPAMQQLFNELRRAAQSDSNVLLVGETGTGKEECARAIHQASHRASGPFVVADLAATVDGLFGSDIFGHVKGAFTGAVSDRPGAAMRAHQGTLFIDEIGDCPLELQTQLLRLLEEKSFTPLGSNVRKKSDVRIVAATHRDLQAEVEAGRFRKDLMFRLSVLTVHLPPLRERLEDVGLLVDELLSRMGRSGVEITQETRGLLASHAWPGNVRELRNAVERAVALGREHALHGEPSQPKGGELKLRELKERMVSAFERDYLKALLARHERKISHAAKEAGIDRVHLHRLIKKYGL